MKFIKDLGRYLVKKKKNKLRKKIRIIIIILKKEERIEEEIRGGATGESVGGLWVEGGRSEGRWGLFLLLILTFLAWVRTMGGAVGGVRMAAGGRLAGKGVKVC